MLTEEDRADAYRQMTDSTRHLLRVARDNDWQNHRVKPDPETNPLAELDWGKEATWDQPVPRATLARACTSGR